MKSIAIFLLSSLYSLVIYGQEIAGKWNGALKIQGTQLRLVFNITKTNNGISSTMDSPDQGAKGIPTTTTNFEDSILKITIANAKIEYEGTLGKDNIIIGTFKQGGQSFPMNLSKAEIEKEKLIRPQEPIKPFAYYSEDVTFENSKEGILLAGTLTLPKKDGIFPVVILVSGSGPQNRDGEVFGHKPFLVISDYLTNNGIGVLRFDDRGSFLSEGDLRAATTKDFATDVAAAIEYLKTRKEINRKKIGLIGHSEGGIIAPMVAIAKPKDVSFIVLLAGQGVTGRELLLLQQEALLRAIGSTEKDIKTAKEFNIKAYDLVLENDIENKLQTELTSLFKSYVVDTTLNKSNVTNKLIEDQVKMLTSPWMKFFLGYDPRPTLERTKCPVFSINGEKDLQVPPKENMLAIKKALSKNKKATVIEIEKLNHFFQGCKTGLPGEYSSLEETFSPIALTEILKWLQVTLEKI